MNLQITVVPQILLVEQHSGSNQGLSWRFLARQLEAGKTDEALTSYQLELEGEGSRATA